MTTGQLELGPARESVYVHQKKDSAILSLELLEETGTEKHNAQSYTVLRTSMPLLLRVERTLTRMRPHDGLVQVYRIRVKWGDCVWTLQRRYSQFREFHQVILLSIVIIFIFIIFMVSRSVMVQAVKWKTSVKLPYPIPKKHLLHSLDYNVIEERKAGLRQYLKGTPHTEAHVQLVVDVLMRMCTRGS